MNKITHIRLSPPDRRNVEDALYAIGPDRIRENNLSQNEIAAEISKKLGIAVTKAHIETAQSALQWAGWPSKTSEVLRNRLHRDGANATEIALCRTRLERHEERLARIERMLLQQAKS